MKLSELLKYIKPIAIIGNAEVDITGVNIDSRKIEKGHLFVAIKGTQADGHRFIPKAVLSLCYARTCPRSLIVR